MTAPHFAVSLCWNFARSSDEVVQTSEPVVSKNALAAAPASSAAILSVASDRLYVAAISDELWCFRAVQIVGADYERVVTGGGKASTQLPQFKAITYMGNLKRSLSGTYHAFDFAKYAHRNIAEARYRFNRRFNLSSILLGALAARRFYHLASARSVHPRG